MPCRGDQAEPWLWPQIMRKVVSGRVADPEVPTLADSGIDGVNPSGIDPLRARTGKLFIELVDPDGRVTSVTLTGSVVHSVAGDLVITAAHGLYNRETKAAARAISFKPGYDRGAAPRRMGRLRLGDS